MFAKHAFLILLCSFVFFHEQVEGVRFLNLFKMTKRRIHGDPCAEIKPRTDRPDKDKPSTSRRRVFFRRSARRHTSYTAEELKDYGNHYFREGKYTEAVRCYNKAIIINRDEPKYWRNRGFSYERLKKPLDAIENYEASLALDPTSVRGRFFLGRQLVEIERYEDSVEHLRLALEYGEQRRMMTDERTQVINMLESAIQKVKEREDARRRAREEALYAYLKMLIKDRATVQISELEESKRSVENDTIGGDIDNRIRAMKSMHDEYLNELALLFEEAEEEREPDESLQIPEYLCDKISYELMKEPVITPDGITYEKSQITKHLESKKTDPSTRSALTNDMLRANKAIKIHIDDFMKKNRITYTTTLGL